MYLFHNFELGANCQVRCHLLNALNKFPVEVVADLLPNLIMGNQAVTGLQQGKEHIVLITYDYDEFCASAGGLRMP